MNCVGAGAFSPIASITTPAAVPGAVLSIRSIPQITSLHLMWKQPVENGSEIEAYNIELSDCSELIAVENILEYIVNGLLPNTTYKYEGGEGVHTHGKITIFTLNNEIFFIEISAAGGYKLK